MSTDQELIQRIAHCWREREQLELELAACIDTAADALDELLERLHPHPAGAALAETFTLWLADTEAQQHHRQDLELHAKAKRLLDEWHTQ